MSALVAAVQTGTQPYQTACAGITGFVSTVEGESVPDSNGGGGYGGFGQAQSVFMGVKTDAMQWINQLFPECTSLPQTFIHEDPTVQGQLNALIASCSQLSQPGVNQQTLLAAISGDVGTLLPVIQSLQQQAAALASSLAGCMQAMTADQTKCQNELGQLQADQWSLQQQYSSLNGQLVQEQHATCPSSSTISSLEAGINSVQDQLNEVGMLLQFYGSLIPQLSNMVNSLHYLNGFWSAVATNGTAVIAVLTKAEGDPASLIKVDLQTALTQWQGLIAYMQAAVG